MNKAFEKILEFIDEQIKIEESIAKSENEGHPITHQYGANCMNVIKKFVQEVAEEYDNGWIAISESVPSSDRFILLSFENYPIPLVGRYVEDDEGGTFYAGYDLPLAPQNLFVNAWMELPEPYKGE